MEADQGGDALPICLHSVPRGGDDRRGHGFRCSFHGSGGIRDFAGKKRCGRFHIRDVGDISQNFDDLFAL